MAQPPPCGHPSLETRQPSLLPSIPLVRCVFLEGYFRPLQKCRGAPPFCEPKRAKNGWRLLKMAPRPRLSHARKISMFTTGYKDESLKRQNKRGNADHTLRMDKVPPGRMKLYEYRDQPTNWCRICPPQYDGDRLNKTVPIPGKTQDAWLDSGVYHNCSTHPNNSQTLSTYAKLNRELAYKQSPTVHVCS